MAKWAKDPALLEQIRRRHQSVSHAGLVPIGPLARDEFLKLLTRHLREVPGELRHLSYLYLISPGTIALYLLLRTIRERGGTPTLGEVMRRLWMPERALAPLLQELIALGWVKLTKSESGESKNTIELLPPPTELPSSAIDYYRTKGKIRSRR